MKRPRIILTTPDFPPLLGGLSTFSKNIFDLLIDMDIDVSVEIWNSRDFFKIDRKVSQADLYIHVHFMGGELGNYPPHKSINFCHGSEILFTSPNLLKRIIKRIRKGKSIKYFEDSLCNFFISKFTQQKLSALGLITNYGRDFIIHNNIATASNLENCPKSFTVSESIKLCSIARDVPHKNFEGVLKFCSILYRYTKIPIELSITSSRFESVDGVKVIPLNNPSDSKLRDIYKESDFNLLLSLDHSKHGFFEGFGLTILEAASVGTPSVSSAFGGLPENVHHLYNGFVLDEIDEENIEAFFISAQNNYSQWSANAFEHLHSSHSMNLYRRIFKQLIEVDSD